MGLVDKVKSQEKVKKQPKKDASSLGLRHLEWLLKTIRDAQSIKGADLQVATDTVQWLQNEYMRLQNEVKRK